MNHIQKERLLQLVENNVLLSIGGFTTSNGSAAKKQIWEDFASELNELGTHRTGVQWKNVNK